MVEKPFYTTGSSFYNSPMKVASNSTSFSTWYSNSQISFRFFLYSSTHAVNCCVISTLLTPSGFESAAWSLYLLDIINWGILESSIFSTADIGFLSFCWIPSWVQLQLGTHLEPLFIHMETLQFYLVNWNSRALISLSLLNYQESIWTPALFSIFLPRYWSTLALLFVVKFVHKRLVSVHVKWWSLIFGAGMNS